MSKYYFDAGIFSQVRWAKGADVASANALVLGADGNYFDITGTTAITSIGSLRIGIMVMLHFDGILTLTHHATDLILPSGANITTAAGDEAILVEYASGDWRCVSYSPASGYAVKQLAASETVAGVSELATDAETVTGTATDRITTPANITAKMAAPGAIGGTTPAAGTFTDLLGLTSVITATTDTTLAAAQCKGQIVRVTATATITLPAVVIGSLVTIISTTAAVVHVKANASDRIILSGVAMDDGDKATSPGNAGNQITVWGDSSAGWTEIGMIGAFTDGGA